MNAVLQKIVLVKHSSVESIDSQARLGRNVQSRYFGLWMKIHVRPAAVDKNRNSESGLDCRSRDRSCCLEIGQPY